MRRRTFLKTSLAACAAPSLARAAAPPSGLALFAPDNLVAWCIVPFDAKRRGPEERAEMLRRLGLRQLAYDWREEHIPSFDAELDALNRHDIRLEAFWFPCGLQPEKEANVRTILDFLRRRKVRTQLWLSLAMKDEGAPAERVAAAARAVGWAADEAARIGCQVGLYNHGGWFGEPDNQLAILEAVGKPDVGLVYNFHHGHAHVARFPELFRRMLPHLLTLNINGMRGSEFEILGVGKGDRELEMLRVVATSSYHGPIGILGHRADVDAEVALRENLDGLRALLPRIGSPS